MWQEREKKVGAKDVEGRTKYRASRIKDYYRHNDFGWGIGITKWGKSYNGQWLVFVIINCW